MSAPKTTVTEDRPTLHPAIWSAAAFVPLLLADIRRRTTTTTTEPSTEVRPQAARELLSSVVAVAKDLTPGKLLVLLAVGLLSVTLFAADSDAATQTGGTRGVSSQGKR